MAYFAKQNDVIEVAAASMNHLAVYSKLFSYVMKRVTEVLPLHFCLFEAPGYDADIPAEKLFARPLWEGHFMPFSHILLLCPTISFSTLTPEELNGGGENKGAAKGDAVVSFWIALNKAYLYIDFEQPEDDWPAIMPVLGPYAEILVYKAARPADKPLYELWRGSGWPENIASEWKRFETKEPNMPAWAKTFDLADFLSNPHRLFKEIRAVLDGAE